MNTAKLVNSALTGGGLIYPENLNVIIGNESKGYPKGYVLDANATLSLAGQASSGSGSQTPGQQGGNSNNTSSNLDKYIKPSQVLYSVDNTGNKSYTTQLNMLSEKENGYLSIDLQSKEYPSDFSLNHVSGDANLNLGNINVILGKNNLAIGSGLYSTNNASNNILLGFRIAIQVKKNPGGKLRLLVKKDSIIEYQLKEDFLGITDRFAINIKDSKLVFEKISDTETLTRISNDFTRIDDNTIEMNNPNLNKLSECYYVVAVSVTSDGRSNILVGNAIFNGGSNSIFVGTALRGKPSSTSKYPNNIQCFGLGNKVSNSCEFASGCYNITNNKTVGNYQYNTVFSIGAGSLSNGNLNALELISKKNITDNTSINALYVNGVGGYDGTNVSDNNTKSLQEVISDISSNSAPLSSYDSVLKCVNSKPMQSSVLDIIGCVKDVLKRGWKNIAVNAIFTKDNEWIVSNTMLFKKGEENKTSTELTLAEIKSDPRNNFSIIDDVCLLAKFYGANVYIYVQNPAAKDIYTKTGDLYNGMSHIQKLVYQLKMFGLSGRYSIVALDQQVLQQVIFADDNARVGLFCNTKFYTNTQLNSNISDFIRDVKGQLPNNSENVFIISNFDIVKDMPVNIMLSLARPNCKLEVSNIDNNINIFDFKFSNPYITAAVCNDVHIGKKLLESNV